MATLTSRRLGTASLAWIAALATFLCSAPALAQSGDDKAAAEALFQQARKLMGEGKYAEACPKLQASQRLDPGVGTLLNLGDCYEKNGQTASAWAQFIEAATEARKVGDIRREEAARARAAALGPRLSHLVITVPADADISGLLLKRDGTPIDRALWGSDIPVDPGDRRIEATAPGRKAWAATITVTEGAATVPVQVPLLVLAPAEPAFVASRVDQSMAPQGEPRDEEGGVLTKWWLWAGAGAVVATAVVVALVVGGSTKTKTDESARVEGTDGMTIATLSLGGR